MAKRRLTPTLILALSLGVWSATNLVGCSTDSTGESADSDSVPAPDAGTDAVPQAAAEGSPDGTPPTAAVADAGTPAAPTDQPPPADGAAPSAPADMAAATPPTDTMAQPMPTADPAAAAPAPAADMAAAQTAPAPVQPDPAQAAPAPADTSSNMNTMASNSGNSGSDSNSGSGGGSDYTVQKGDTLMKIAFETYGDLYKWKDIYEGNRGVIKDPNAVPPGTTLKLDKPGTAVSIERNGDQYLIKSGDTLGTISNDVYGTKSKWKRLWENNKQLIKDPNKIYAGFYLFYTLTPDERDNMEKRKDNPAAPKPLAEETSPAPSQAMAPQQNMAPQAMGQNPGMAPQQGAPQPGASQAMAPQADNRAPSSVGQPMIAPPMGQGPGAPPAQAVAAQAPAPGTVKN